MGDSQRSQVFQFDNDDPDMKEAYRSARVTFKYFWREMAWEQRRIVTALDLACVKAPFSDADRPGARPNSTEIEQMWVSDVAFDGKYLSGTLINSPNELRTYKQGDSVRLKLDQITDWMYVISGDVYGAYTVNLMRSRMDRKERKEHDSAWGLNFGDPTTIKLVPGSDDGDEESPESTEHKMSEAMAESLKESLAERPSLLHDTDDKGMTLLHQLCLAGSAATVKVLLDAGADRNAVTKRGLTPLQLAQVLGWKRVIRLLKPGATLAADSIEKSVEPKRNVLKRPSSVAATECEDCGAVVRRQGTSSTGRVLCKDCSRPQKAKSESKKSRPVDVTFWVVIGVLLTFFLLTIFAALKLWGALSEAAAQPEQKKVPPIQFEPNRQLPSNIPNFSNPPNFPPPLPPVNPAESNSTSTPPDADSANEDSDPATVPAPETPNTPRGPRTLPGRRAPFPQRNRRMVPPNNQPGQPNLPQTNVPSIPLPDGRNIPIAGRWVPNAEKTETYGGTGGVDFHLDLGNEPLAGLDWRMGEWDGVKAIGQFMPLAQARRDKTPIFERTVAPDGYAVGAIKVSGDKYVSHLQFVFMKLKEDGSLDPDDTELSEWIGGKPSSFVTTISGKGKRVIGLHGKRAVVMDAVGLLLAP